MTKKSSRILLIIVGLIVFWQLVAVSFTLYEVRNIYLGVGSLTKSSQTINQITTYQDLLVSNQNLHRTSKQSVVCFIPGLVREYCLLSGLVDEVWQDNQRAVDQIINHVSSGENFLDLEPSERNQIISSASAIAKSALLRSKNQDFTILAKFNLKEVLEIVAALPGVVGGPDEKNYLVIFQNNAELRPTGGFWGALAELKVKDGLVASSQSQSIFLTPGGLPEIPVVPKDIRSLIESITKEPLQTQYVNSISEFDKVVEYAEPLISRETKTKYNGVIAIDLQAMRGLLKIVGPVQVPNIGLVDSDNLVEKLVYDPYLREADLDLTQIRKNGLGETGLAIINRLFFASPAKIYTWLFESINQQTLLFNSANNLEFRSLAEKINAEGSRQSFGSNFIHLEEINFSGKQSLFLERVVKLDKIGKTKYRATLTYNYRNSEIARNLYYPQNKSLIRLRLPSGTKLINSTGGEQSPGNQVNIYSTVGVSNILVIDPGETKQLVYDYELPENIAKQKPKWTFQPGMTNYQIDKVDGSSSYDANLN